MRIDTGEIVEEKVVKNMPAEEQKKYTALTKEEYEVLSVLDPKVRKKTLDKLRKHKKAKRKMSKKSRKKNR